MPASNYYHIDDCVILAESEHAFLVRLPDTEEFAAEEEWVPKSQLADPEDYKRGDALVTLSVTEWFAKKRGWL